MWKYLVERLKEPSSWAGIAAAASQVVEAVATKNPVAITTVLLGVAAVLNPEGSPK